MRCSGERSGVKRLVQLELVGFENRDDFPYFPDSLYNIFFSEWLTMLLRALIACDHNALSEDRIYHQGVEHEVLVDLMSLAVISGVTK